MPVCTTLVVETALPKIESLSHIQTANQFRLSKGCNNGAPTKGFTCALSVFAATVTSALYLDASDRVNSGFGVPTSVFGTICCGNRVYYLLWPRPWTTLEEGIFGILGGLPLNFLWGVITSVNYGTMGCVAGIRNRYYLSATQLSA